MSKTLTILCWLGISALVALMCTSAHAEGTDRKAQQHRNFAKVRALLDESDIPTDGPQTIVSHAIETPCRISIQQTPASEGGTAVGISIDLRHLDFSQVVPGVQMHMMNGIDYGAQVLFVEHAKTAGVKVETIQYCVGANDALVRCPGTAWSAPHVSIHPRRALGKLHDRVLSDEADRENVHRLHVALAQLGASCRD